MRRRGPAAGSPEGAGPPGAQAQRRPPANRASFTVRLRAGDGWCSGSSVTVAATEHRAPDKRRSRSCPQPSLPGDKRCLPVESGIPGCPPPAGLCSGAAGSPGGEGGPGLSAAAAAALFPAPRGPLARVAERLLGPFLAPLATEKAADLLAAGGDPTLKGRSKPRPPV